MSRELIALVVILLVEATLLVWALTERSTTLIVMLSIGVGFVASSTFSVALNDRVGRAGRKRADK